MTLSSVLTSQAMFLSNMSHELRTPLNAVIGISRLLVSTELTLEQQQYVNMVSNSSKLLDSLRCYCHHVSACQTHPLWQELTRHESLLCYTYIFHTTAKLTVVV